jgi:hypothetical protein
VESGSLKAAPVAVAGTAIRNAPGQTIMPTQRRQYSLLAKELLRQQEQTSELFRERILSITEVRAALGGLTAGTIRKWLRCGYLKGFRVGRLGHWKIPVSEVLRLRGEK